MTPHQIVRIPPPGALRSIALSFALAATVACGQGGPEPDPLIAAVRRHDAAALKAQLRKGVGFIQRGAALRIAAAGANREAVDLLLQNPPDYLIDDRNAAGFTPLLFAAIRGDVKIVDRLIADEADVDVPGESGLTPLMAAADHGHIAVVRSLIAAKAVINARDTSGRTALELARAAGHEAVADALRKAGAVPGERVIPLKRLQSAGAPQPPPKRLDERQTIAMAPFSSSDHTYRSAMAAEDFSTLLQSRISSQYGGKWIERADIRKAESELKLKAFGLVDAAHGVQIGKWLKADLVVTGRFGVDEGHGRRLEIEIIDTEHADVLATGSFTIRGELGAPLKIAASDVTAVSKIVAPALARAFDAFQAAKGRLTIAPLFFRNVSPESDRLGFLENDLGDAFTAKADARFRVIRFPRAQEASGESELIVGGLVERDPDLWQRLAEVYVWGDYSEVKSADVAFENVPVRLTVHVCKGATEVDQVEEQFLIGQREAAMGRVVEKVFAAASRASVNPPAGNTRAQLAQSLIARSREVKKSALTPMDDDRPRSRYRMRLLEIAYFMEPGSEDIHRELMLERWYDSAFLSGSPYLRTGRYFWGTWRQSDDWRKHVERFGILSLDKFPKGDVPPQNKYFGLPFEVIARLVNGGRGFPDDVPDDVHRKWMDDFATDLYQRLKVIDRQCPEKFASELYPLGQIARNLVETGTRADIFGLLWKLGSGQRTTDADGIENFKSLLRSAYSLAGRETEAEPILKQGRPPVIVERAKPPFKLPDFAEMNRKTKEDIEKLKQPHPLAVGEVESRFQLIPVADGVHSVPMVLHAQDSLWAVFTQNPPYPSMLWRRDPNGSAMVAIDAVSLPDGPILRQRFTSIFEHGGNLWLGSDQAGVWRFDPKSRALKVFDGKDGLPTMKISSSVVVGDEIYVGGGEERAGRIGAFDLKQQTWRAIPGNFGRILNLASQKHRLFTGDFFGSAYRFGVWDTRTREWSDITGAHPFKNWPVFSYIGDESGIWLTFRGELVHLDLEAKSYTPLFTFAGKVTSLLSDGEFLWISTENPTFLTDMNHYTKVYLLHKPSHKLVGFSLPPFNAEVNSMATSGNRLWLGLKPGSQDHSYLAEMDKTALLSVPREKWLGDLPPPVVVATPKPQIPKMDDRALADKLRQAGCNVKVNEAGGKFAIEHVIYQTFARKEEDFALLDQLGGIWGLVIQRNAASDAMIEYARGCTSLTKLELSSLPNITGKALQIATSMPKLMSLRLFDVNIDEESFRSAFKDSQVRDLNLVRIKNGITDAFPGTLAEMPNLASVTLDGLPEFTANGWLALSKAQKLQIVTLRNSWVSADGLANLGKCATLVDLRIEDCRVTDGDLQPLLTMGRLTGVTLKNNASITAAFVASLKAARPTLEITLNGQRQ